MRSAVPFIVGILTCVPMSAHAETTTARASLQAVLQVVLDESPSVRIYEARRRAAAAERLRAEGPFDAVLSTSVVGQRELLQGSSGLRSTRGYDELFAQLTLGARTRDNIWAEIGAASPVTSDLETRNNPSQPVAWASFVVPLLKLGPSSWPAAIERAAVLHAAATGALAREQRSELAMRVAAEYWRWVASHAQVRLMTKLEALARDQLRDVDALIASELRPKSDRLPFAAAADNASAARVQAQQLMRNQQLATWSVLGRPLPAGIDAPEDELPTVPCGPGTTASVIAQATRRAARRPLFDYLEKERAAAGVMVDAAHTASRPNVDLTVRGQVTRAELDRDSARMGVGYAGAIGVTFSFPVQNRAAIGGLDYAGQVHTGRALDAEARASVVTNALVATATDLVGLAETHEIRARARAEFEAAYEAERARYRAGDVTAMDVLVVEQRFMTSSLLVLADETAYALALARLSHESGSLAAALDARNAHVAKLVLTKSPFATE